MAIDTAAKRAAVGGVPALPLGVNVTPGTLATLLGRGAAAWNYLGTPLVPPTPGVEGLSEKTTLGTKESMSVTSDPTLGGWWGH